MVILIVVRVVDLVVWLGLTSFYSPPRLALNADDQEERAPKVAEEENTTG